MADSEAKGRRKKKKREGPLLLALGGQWDLYLLRRAEGGEVVILGRVKLGESGGLLDVYRLMEGIRAVAGRRKSVWGGWLEEL